MERKTFIIFSTDGCRRKERLSGSIVEDMLSAVKMVHLSICLAVLTKSVPDKRLIM